MTALSNEEVFAELYYTKRIIKDVLGVTPTCWRPPFGDVDNRVRMIANALNLRTIIWSEDSVSRLSMIRYRFSIDIYRLIGLLTPEHQ